MPTSDEVIRNYQTATRAVRDRISEYGRRVWVGLGSYRDAEIERLVDLIVPQVLAGQRTIATLTDAYLAGLAGIAATGIDVDAVSGTAVRGVALEEVYQRPGKTVWTALAAGKAPDAAIASGMSRLMSLLATDLQMAQRIQEQTSLAAGGFEFYRRVLTGRENCGLCVIASTQRYRTGTLKPIHPGCDCGVAQLTDTDDPGQVLNEALLEQMHEQVGLTFGNDDRGARTFIDRAGREIDYRDIRVREHGEYGPTLTWAKDDFTGPDAI